jgi:hypothetical protein
MDVHKEAISIGDVASGAGDEGEGGIGETER